MQNNFRQDDLGRNMMIRGPIRRNDATKLQIINWRIKHTFYYYFYVHIDIMML